MDDSATEDQLVVGELTPAPGGRWNGLLFDNPTIGLKASLSWSFYFPYLDVERDFGDSPVSLSVEWAGLAPSTWREMAGQVMSCAEFAEPAEASVYYFQHHRFEAVDLRVLEQRETEIHVAATVSGDLDRLGIDRVDVDGWLSFSGIIVSLRSVRSAAGASARLGEFIDVTGLSCSPGAVAGTFVFRPAG